MKIHSINWKKVESIDKYTFDNPYKNITYTNIFVLQKHRRYKHVGCGDHKNVNL